MLSAPFERLSSSPDWTRATAAALGVVQFLYRDLWAVALFFMVACAAGDFWAGVTRAKLSGPDVFSATIAHRGLATKVISLLLTFLVRIGEHFMSLVGLPDTNGMLAVAALAGFGIADIRSIIAHREAMGGGPIPLVSAIIDRIEALFGTRAEVVPAGPQRRKDDA